MIECQCGVKEKRLALKIRTGDWGITLQNPNTRLKSQVKIVIINSIFSLYKRQVGVIM